MKNQALIELTNMVGADETVYLSECPNMKSFMKQNLVSPLLLISSVVLPSAIYAWDKLQPLSDPNEPMWKVIGVIFFMLIPFFSYLGVVLTLYPRYNHNAYVVTNKGIYASRGIFSCEKVFVPFSEINGIYCDEGMDIRSMDGGLGQFTFGYGDTFFTQKLFIVSHIRNHRQVVQIVEKAQRARNGVPVQ